MRSIELFGGGGGGGGGRWAMGDGRPKYTFHRIMI